MKIVIPLNPVTKKNSQRILINHKTGKPFIAQNQKYKEYENECGWYLGQFKGLQIDYPVNLKVIYYRKTRHRVDLINLHEALQDILVKYGVLKDDNVDIVHSLDGSRVMYDKENPRTEIEIRRI